MTQENNANKKDQFLGTLLRAVTNFTKSGQENDYQLLVETLGERAINNLTPENEEAMIQVARWVDPNPELIDNLFQLTIKSSQENQPHFAELYKDKLVKSLSETPQLWTDKKLFAVQTNHLGLEKTCPKLTEESKKHIKTAHSEIVYSARIPRNKADVLNKAEKLSLPEFQENFNAILPSYAFKAKSHRLNY